MNRYKVNLKSGKLKNPKLMTAGDDFEVGDVVINNDGVAMPMFNEEQEMFGVVSAPAKKGGKVLIAAKGAE